MSVVRKLMNHKKENQAYWLFILLFLLGLTLRLVNLGRMTPTTDETSFAWQALQTSTQQNGETNFPAGLTGLTALSFFLFGPSLFAARVWPALIGSFLIFLPLLWKDVIGKTEALLLSLALLIDPLLFFSSRQADSYLLGIVALLFAFSFLRKKQYGGLGISLALGLLGGYSFWFGLAVLSILLLIHHLMHKDRNEVQSAETSHQENILHFPPGLIKKSILPFALTLILVSTAFTLNPSGLSTIMDGLIDFIQKFSIYSGVLLDKVIISVLGYAFLPFLFGIAGLIKGLLERNRIFKYLLYWFLLSTALILLMPDREVVDIVFLVLPLWVAAVKIFVSFVAKLKGSQHPQLRNVILLFIVIILTYLSMNLRTIVANALVVDSQLQIYITFIAGLGLIVLAFLLIGFLWDFHFASTGVFTALFIFLFVITSSLSFKIANFRETQNAHLLGASPLKPNTHLLTDTMRDIINRSGIDPEDASVRIVDMPVEDFAWDLREFNVLNPSDLESIYQTPDFLISSSSKLASYANEYRGQKFSWQVWENWLGMSLIEKMEWIINHELVLNHSDIILWVRSDLFPGVSLGTKIY